VFLPAYGAVAVPAVGGGLELYTYDVRIPGPGEIEFDVWVY
jgi:hypothetical protein